MQNVKCCRMKVGLHSLKAKMVILEIQSILLICRIKSSKIRDDGNGSKFTSPVKRSKTKLILKVIEKTLFLL